MPHHHRDSDHGRGISRRHALDRMSAVLLPSVAPILPILLDTGDADEFTFATTGGLACSRGVRPPGEITGAA